MKCTTKLQRSGLVALLVAAALPTAAFSATLEVPGTYATIQDAVDVAVAGDTVMVSDGIYTGVGNRDVVVTLDITIRSLNGPGLCTIDCGGMGRAFHVSSGAAIEGFTIVDGFTSGEGAAILVAGGAPTIEDCVFQGNSAVSTGVGGVNLFSGNGGAIAFAIGAGGSVVDCGFLENSAVSTGAFIGDILSGVGGAILVSSGATVSVTGSSFTGNAAVSSGLVGNGFGGAIATDLLNLAPVLLTIEDCLFMGNSAAIAGGGLWLFGGHVTVVEGSLFDGNTAKSSAGVAFQTDADVTIRDSEFRDNVCGAAITFLFAGVQEQIGGAAVGGGGASTDEDGNPLTGGSVLTLEDVLFTGNRSLSGRGGALSTFGLCTTTIDRCEFRGNEAALEGGAIVNQEAPALAALGPTFPATMTITNTLVVCNETGSLGGGVANLEGSTLTMGNVTLGHNAAANGGGLANMGLGSVSTVVNSVLWGNSAFLGPAGRQILDGPGGAAVTFSLVKNGWPGMGNTSKSPRWVEADEDDCPGDDSDYRLSHRSPAIDAGDNGAVTTASDLDGNARIVGPSVDMGAYERQN